MIKFQRITTTDAALYKYMEQLMTASFPSEEYRPLEELRNYTDSKPHFYCNIILHQNTPVGFITYWDFGHFCYVEHFAIDPSQRNGGHGKNVLNQLCHQLKKPIILEVEMPKKKWQYAESISTNGKVLHYGKSRTCNRLINPEMITFPCY